MEQADREMILALSKDIVELRRLYEKHQKLEEILARYEHRTFLSDQEEHEIRRLKREKLAGVDTMMGIVRGSRA